MNRVFLIGRLTKDIELRYTNNNIACAQFDIAINNGKDKEGNERKPEFVKIVVWDKKAENCHKYLKKGSKVAVEGRIQTRSYDTENGQKRYVTEVVSENVQFLDSFKYENPLPSEPDYLGQSQNNPYQEMGNQVSADFQDEEGYPWEC